MVVCILESIETQRRTRLVEWVRKVLWAQLDQVIASLSLGARRTFIMHPHISKGEKKVDADAKRWILANGSLLVMQGDTQENWKVSPN